MICDEFYEKLQNVVEGISKHDILVVLGDMNAKVGRETDIFGKAIGRHSLHQECNENGLRLCSFAEANNLVIGGTIFPIKGSIKNLGGSLMVLPGTKLTILWSTSASEVHCRM